MTKANILSILKANNKNEDIKWDVLENTKNMIAITNDYDSKIRFEIRLNQGEGQDISIVDTFGWKETLGYVIIGDDRWADCKDVESGIAQAVKMVAKSFYYYY